MHVLQLGEFSTYGVQCGRIFPGTSFHRTFNLACTLWTLLCDRSKTSKIKHQSIKLRSDLAYYLSLNGSECVEGTNIVEEGSCLTEFPRPCVTLIIIFLDFIDTVGKIYIRYPYETDV